MNRHTPTPVPHFNIDIMDIKNTPGITSLSGLLNIKLSTNQKFKNLIFYLVITNKLANTNSKAFSNINDYSKKFLETHNDPKL